MTTTHRKAVSRTAKLLKETLTASLKTMTLKHFKNLVKSTMLRVRLQDHKKTLETSGIRQNVPHINYAVRNIPSPILVFNSNTGVDKSNRLDRGDVLDHKKPGVNARRDLYRGKYVLYISRVRRHRLFVCLASLRAAAAA